ncbi:hypothetical protein CDAR_217371 [Caerostris darwini]|uniref:Uncharacterized protein n=1 Tax=Caerostris darwini TaxID=1538125 RepID=A0AAV4SGD9_9ARAC|nr:hypothetical protein CDAR_217371 [Caerostris darwini]
MVNYKQGSSKCNPPYIIPEGREQIQSDNKIKRNPNCAVSITIFTTSPTISLLASALFSRFSRHRNRKTTGTCSIAKGAEREKD